MKDTNIEISNDFLKALDDYLENYFKNRNEKKALALLSEHIRGYGTGLDEVALEPTDYLDLYRRDFETIKTPIDYTVYDLRFYSITNNVAIAMFQNDISFQVDEQNIVMKHIRQTIVFRRIKNNIVIDHLHASFPANIQSENESYPILEIKEITEQLKHRFSQNETDTLSEDYKNLELMVNTDYLTGLANRFKIDETLNTEIKRAKLLHSTFSIIMIDIDAFKDINDRFGHTVGDQYLKNVASIIKQQIRVTDTAGRWGGDEYIIILPETKVFETKDVCEKINQAIEKKFKSEVSLTYGIATYIKGDNVKSIFDRADKNLYKNKSSATNKIN